jgi:8-amino-7-oxononanoate synthase
MKPSYREALDRLRENGRLRQLHPLDGREGSRVNYEGSRLLNLTSNDYLGLAANRALLERFYAGIDSDSLIDRFGLGVASSRLLSGDYAVAHELEQTLAATYCRPAALLYNSGYHANIGILPALTDKGDLILSDKLNHASVHDGLRLSQAEHRRYRHRDYDHLEAVLEQLRSNYERVIVVSESVFSMDGDVADLRRLVKIKNRFDCLLYVDEAHAVGLYGERGLGQSEEQGVLNDVDLLIGTFGKALASVGAFVLCSEDIREYLVNRSRSLIFTTALPPVVISWNHFVFRHMLGLGRQRLHLQGLAGKLRSELMRVGLSTAGSTNIVPVLIGQDVTTVRLAEAMRKGGWLIFPVRPPTVPEGTARLRLSLTADMLWQEELAPLAAAIATELGELQGSSGR